VLVKPIQIALESGNYALHDLYQRVLTVEPGVTDVLPITRSTWQRAATVRAQLSRFADVAIKLPDAVHLAAALDGRCDTFLTNDKSLQTATRALIERRGIAEQDSLPSIKRLVTFNPAELDTLAAELGCP